MKDWRFHVLVTDPRCHTFKKKKKINSFHVLENANLLW